MSGCRQKDQCTLPAAGGLQGSLFGRLPCGACLIFERTGKVVKSHGGMRAMFALVAKDDRALIALAALLGRAYKFKEVADYGVGSQAVITETEARGVIDIARSFVDTIGGLLPPGAPPPHTASEPKS